MLNALEKKILNFIQGDLPLRSDPYSKLAADLGIDEGKIVKTISSLEKRGYVRRFGAILTHHKVGLKTNCMCVWKIPPEKVEKIGGVCSREPSISHCYLRQSKQKWSYNFYTMIHARTKTECLKIIRKIANKCAVKEYELLFTLKQFKKISPLYRV